MAFLLLAPFLANVAYPAPDDLTPVQVTLLTIGITVGIIGLGFVAKLLFKMMGERCPNCSHRLFRGDRVDKSRACDALRFYSEFEGDKHKSLSDLFFCAHCRHVYDDAIDSTKGSPLNAYLEDCGVMHCRACGVQNLTYLGDIIRTTDYSRVQESNQSLIDVLPCLRCKQNPFSSVDCRSCPTPLTALGCKSCKAVYAWLPLFETQMQYLVLLNQATLQFIPKAMLTQKGESNKSAGGGYSSGWLGRV